MSDTLCSDVLAALQDLYAICLAMEADSTLPPPTDQVYRLTMAAAKQAISAATGVQL